MVLKPLAVPNMQFQRTDGISDALYAFELALMLVRPRAPPALLGETLQVVPSRVESENNPLTPYTAHALLSKTDTTEAGPSRYRGTSPT